MPFDTLNPGLQAVGHACFAFCKDRFGKTGAKCDAEIESEISWKPTIQVKSGVKIIAVEVEDKLYPEILKIAAHDIRHSETPIVVYQACSLEAYQSDRKQQTIRKLQSHGFGIITVDELGTVLIQHKAVPLLQHISDTEFEAHLKGLTPKLRVAFREAHNSYLTDPGQGLQAAGQIVEAQVKGMAKALSRKGLSINPNAATANIIDKMYAEQSLQEYRGAGMGGTRDFVKEYRNVASHPAKRAKDAAEKLRKCREGFLQALALSKKLRAIAKSESLNIQIHFD
jgi:hypothetical protein